MIIPGYPHPNYVYLDTEFLPDDFSRGGTVSSALATKDSSYYAVNADMDFEGIFFRSETAEWMRENVMRHLPVIPSNSVYGAKLDLAHRDVKPIEVITAEVNAFVKGACPTGDKDDVEFVVNSGAQDMVRFHGIISGHDWGRHDPWIPKYSDDIARIKRRARHHGITKEDLPVQSEETRHHPLYDARHEMSVHQYILDRVGLV